MSLISDARGSHVSPGVYTDERDVTYSVKSLGITSLGLVGETLYGPAFQNVEIENWGEYVDYFGGTSTEKFANGKPKYEAAYIAKSYLEESRRLNMVRVLGLSGYDAGKVWPIKYGTDENNKLVIVLRGKKEIKPQGDDCATGYTATELVEKIEIVDYKEDVKIINCTGNTTETQSNNLKFGLKVTLTNGSEKVYNVSLNSNDSNYIYKVFGNKPNAGKAEVYVEAVYEKALTENCAACDFKIDANTGLDDYNDYKSPYRYAQTPWIVSEALINSDESNKNVTMKRLFKFVTISDGDAANYQVKVSIQNVNSDYGTFDVVVRDFNDTDANPVILERFSKCNLVDGDVNYIAAKIGDVYGGFNAKSKYISVMMADETEDVSNSIPAGFVGYPIPDFYSATTFDVNYNKVYNPGVKSRRQFFGASNIDVDILSFKGVNTYDENTVDFTPDKLSKGFHMDSRVSEATINDVTGFTFDSISSANTPNGKYEPIFTPSIMGGIYEDINLRQFTVCFYGGFDGWDANSKERTTGNDYKSTKYKGGFYTEYANNADRVNIPEKSITSDYYAYLAGCRVFMNPQDVDINILATPGINWLDDELLTEEIIDIVEDKENRGGDALYVMASPNSDNAKEVSGEFRINSSYACTYFPWVLHYDSSNRRYLELPATKDVVKNMAHIDNTSFPWFAPAGMSRGNVECVKAVFKTSLNDEDMLYEAGINPIKSYAQDGVKVWGNKTAYDVESPLNRINVRRLMIRVKKMITEAAKHLIFEQYDATLEKQFKNIVEPILADVKANRGIIDYRVITEVTPETRDQHILPCRVLIKPTQTLEYISLSFVIYPESVEFQD